ncbi:pentapeptide repeat-containing protein [Prochlorothrix hollandica]|uniref:pentapeptide repeat-containing protein n=1 Tax=Prochlorothrix hollandica TaxID=1223 RepID=UPI00334218B3
MSAKPIGLPAVLARFPDFVSRFSGTRFSGTRFSGTRFSGARPSGRCPRSMVSSIRGGLGVCYGHGTPDR